jgi:hypothetical protein
MKKQTAGKLMSAILQTTSSCRFYPIFLGCIGLVCAQLSAPAQTLAHRYTFNAPADPTHGGSTLTTNIADSVAGPGWDAVSMTGGSANSSPVNGLFDGLGTLWLTQQYQDFVQMPAGVLSNYTAVTIDAWFTFPDQIPGNAQAFAFGNTDSGGLGQNYFAYAEAGGRIFISNTDPGFNAEQSAAGAGNASFQTNLHVTAVCDPPNRTLALYYNGVLKAVNRNLTFPLSSVSNVLSFINRSLYTGDPYADMGVSEFRIWNGGLNGLQVGASDVNGPNNTNINFGTVTSLSMALPHTTIPQSTHESASATATATGSGAAPADVTQLTTFSSGNTSIIGVTNNVIYGLHQGIANVIATFDGFSVTQAVTVAAPPSAALAHRYSFTAAADPYFGGSVLTTNVTDSIGGAAWKATCMTGGSALPTASNGKFDGQSNLLLTAASQDFVQFPAGIISNLTSVTIEGWFTFPDQLPGNCMAFAFGNTDSGGAGEKYIACAPQGGRVFVTDGDPGWAGPEQNATGAGDLSYQTNLHVTAVCDPPNGVIALYTNGVLVAANTFETYPLNSVQSVLNFIGRSLYNGDPYPDMSVSEFRIYNGALNANQVAATQILGPSQLLSTGSPTLNVAYSSGQVTLSWPLAAASFQLTSSSNLISGNWQLVTSPAAQIVGNLWQVVLPASAVGSQFFRLLSN